MTEPIETLDRLAETLAAARRDLETRIAAEDRDVAAARKPHARVLRHMALKYRKAEAALRAAVDANRQLFRKPRTRTLHDIRFGLMKGKGRIAWDNEAKVIARVKAQLPSSVADLIQTTETLSKTSLSKLPAVLLKKLGFSVVDSQDEVVVKAAPSDVERRIKALLASPNDTAEG